MVSDWSPQLPDLAVDAIEPLTRPGHSRTPLSVTYIDLVRLGCALIGATYRIPIRSDSLYYFDRPRGSGSQKVQESDAVACDAFGFKL